MRTTSICIAMGLASALCTAAPARAQSTAEVLAGMEQMKGTLQVEFQPVLSAGALNGCSLVFDVLHTDGPYKRGQYIRVAGNIAIMSNKGALGAALKVVLYDFDPKTMERYPASPPPTRAYLIGDDYRTNMDSLVNAIGTSTPGAVFAIFKLEPTFEMIAAAIIDKTATIAFNRGDATSDVSVPIDLSVSGLDARLNRKHSSVATDKFTDCLDKLARANLAK